MHEPSIPLTTDLIRALTDRGFNASLAEPVVIVAAYLDAVAKEYGLTESTSLDTDPLERVEQSGPVMDVLARHLWKDAEEADADALRSRICEVVVMVAEDASARRLLNRNRPLTKDQVLRLAQIYWNIEATPQREQLPIKPAPPRDIPVAGVSKDFATMKWTDRTKQKSHGKSSGQSFRTQGARLAVLVSERIVGTPTSGSEPVPDVAIEQTDDPSAPLHVTLKTLAESAYESGRLEDALDLAGTRLAIVQRLADEQPLEWEGALADAFLQKGFLGVVPHPKARRASPVEFRTGIEDLRSSVTSLTMLVELEPDRADLLEDLRDALFVLVGGLGVDPTLDPGAQTANAEALVGVAENCQRVNPGEEADQWLILSQYMYGEALIEDAHRPRDAVLVLERTIDQATRWAELHPDDKTGKSILSMVRSDLIHALVATGKFVRAEEIGLSASEDLHVQKAIATARVEASNASRDAGNLQESVVLASSAVDAARWCYEHDPGSISVFVLALQGLNYALKRANQPARALEVLREALVVAAASGESDNWLEHSLYVALLHLGDIVGLKEKTAVAKRTVEYFLREDSAVPAALVEPLTDGLVVALHSLALDLANVDKHKRAVKVASSAVQLAEAFVEKYPSNTQKTLGSSLIVQALMFELAGRHKKARKAHQRFEELDADGDH